ncbi:MAG: hypothetical protein U0790_11870 [Isosphaeraceae bacterium]
MLRLLVRLGRQGQPAQEPGDLPEDLRDAACQQAATHGSPGRPAAAAAVQVSRRRARVQDRLEGAEVAAADLVQL